MEHDQNEEKGYLNLDMQAIEKKAMVGFILGLVGIVAWFLPIIGFPVTIVGLVQSIKGKKAVNRRGLAIAGLILNLIFLVVTSINSLLGAILNLMAL